MKLTKLWGDIRKLEPKGAPSPRVCRAIEAAVEQTVEHVLGGWLTVVSTGEAAVALGQDPADLIPEQHLVHWEIYSRAKQRALDDLRLADQGGRLQ